MQQGITIQQALSRDLGEGESNFYQGKDATMKYFFHYELPKVKGLFQRLKEVDGLTVNLTAAHFDD